MTEFAICANEYLKKNTKGYYDFDYVGYGQPENPDFLNWLKNTFNNESILKLERSRQLVEKTLCKAIPEILSKEGITTCVLACVPRAKMLSKYHTNQIMFIEAVSRSADKLNLIDGAYCIKRYKDTKTTHLGRAKDLTWVAVGGDDEGNDGSMPYIGITKDTCIIENDLIQGKTVILVDDIYTRTVNIDEDCIQALYDAGAEKVIFYAVAKTRRKNEVF